MYSLEADGSDTIDTSFKFNQFILVLKFVDNAVEIFSKEVIGCSVVCTKGIKEDRNNSTF